MRPISLFSNIYNAGQQRRELQGYLYLDLTITDDPLRELSDRFVKG